MVENKKYSNFEFLILTVLPMIIPKASRLNAVKEYYFSIKLAKVKQMQQEGKPVLNLAIGSPDLPPSSSAIAQLIKSVQNPQNHAYQPYKGIAMLRESMASFYQYIYEVRLDPTTEILPLLGSKEGITHISLAFLNPGDEVLVPELGYPAYTSVSQMAGAKVRYYSLLENQNWQIDFEALNQQDLQKVKIMWLNYPHMPTGASPERATFEKLIIFAKKHKILLCHDNPYSLILNTTKPLSLLSLPQAKEVTIELNSMSKSHNMAGWRVGWISGTQDYIDAILTIKSNVDSGMFLPVQHAAIEALKSPAEWYQQQNKVYAERREIVYQIMDKLDCTYTKNQVGMFVWAKIPSSYKSSEQLTEELLNEKHLFITPGFIFGKKGEKYIRLSLCNNQQLLTEALHRL